ncbi:MAG: TIGR02206 family membrane protein [Bacteroidia bacterium]|nr:TIGR02206 family membrane protein [Bacteroidia bacterium]
MDKNNFFYEYVTNYEPFTQFSPSHWWAILVSVFLCIFLPFIAKRYLSPAMQLRTGEAIGIIIFMSYFAWAALELLAGTFDIKKHLPFQLCRFSNVVVILMMNYRSKFWFEILYFWVVTGVLQATFTPDFQQEFPHFYYFRYWIGHPGMIVAIVYAIVVYEMKPTLTGFRNAFIATNVYALFTIILNLSIGSNYFYTLSKPSTASALDYFGPWPWYILVCEFVLIAQASIFYLPFYKHLFSGNKSA